MDALSEVSDDCSVEVTCHLDVAALVRGGVYSSVPRAVALALRMQIVEFGYVDAISFYGDFIDDVDWFQAFERAAGILGQDELRRSTHTRDLMVLHGNEP